jgi:hypothetical protein
VGIDVAIQGNDLQRDSNAQLGSSVFEYSGVLELGGAANVALAPANHKPLLQ